jgi:hypothetical protein
MVVMNEAILFSLVFLVVYQASLTERAGNKGRPMPR